LRMIGANDDTVALVFSAGHVFGDAREGFRLNVARLDFGDVQRRRGLLARGGARCAEKTKEGQKKETHVEVDSSGGAACQSPLGLCGTVARFLGLF
jgi:hypothetical protein